MIRLTVTVEGEPQFDRTLTRFTELVDDLRPIWPGVLEDFREIEKQQFAGQGIGDGGRWQPLSAAYAKIKAQEYPGKPILRRTDRLYNSLTGNTADTSINAQPRRLSIGTRVFYGRFHQRGGGRLVQRRPIDLNEAQRTRLVKTIQRRLLLAGRNNGIPLK
jgi:phage gpG-like protein